MTAPASIEVTAEGYRFVWEVSSDRAYLERIGQGEIWSGSLLPLFWTQEPGHGYLVLKAELADGGFTGSHPHWRLVLRLGDAARGVLSVTAEERGLLFTALEIEWNSRPQPLHTMYFGCTPLTASERCGAPSLERPFWPDWRAEGFGVASAKTNPMQSFFRSWDFGHAELPLGSFGPAMGTPYAAAFPRPTYAAGMGGRHGWITFGPGLIPDAALTCVVRSRSGALEWKFREDLWGAPGPAARRWENPLWLTWDSSLWECHQRHFARFAAAGDPSPHHQRSFWGTWGDFRLGRYEIRGAVDRAVAEQRADLICVDESWENTKGSCTPHVGRFPNFVSDLAYAREHGLGIGLWMPLAWIGDPAAAGLTEDDLLLSRDGRPVLSNWAVDPREPGHPCLDPSSEKARNFLRARTQRVMREYRPALLKIDFGYGVPGPDACTPRDPALRGERLAWTLAHLIRSAAREIDPNVTVMGYSVHPLWDDAQDLVALDDLGDAGMHEVTGHAQWSIWAALAGRRGRALMASSGYLWSADADIALNSAVLGAPGANLPELGAVEENSIRVARARRAGMVRWHRRTVGWRPLWLDSRPGNLTDEPTTRNWGRLEKMEGKAEQLTALALRDPGATLAAELDGLSATGRWAILVPGQETGSIFTAARVAIIPFSTGEIALPCLQPPARVRKVSMTGEEAFDGWSWDGERAVVVVGPELEREPFLGFLLCCD